MARNMKTLVLALAAWATFAGLAEAHPGHGAAGFAAGLTHPLSGLDHMLAMVAVGLFAVRLGGKALWAVPAAFVAMMAVGGVLGMNDIALPFVEFGIAASVIVLGTAIALDLSMPIAAAAGMTGFFALFHGYAHGAEMPMSGSGLDYALGFTASTVLLHGLGLAVGLAAMRATGRAPSGVVKAAGAAMAIAGLGLLSGVI